MSYRNRYRSDEDASLFVAIIVALAVLAIGYLVYSATAAQDAAPASAAPVAHTQPATTTNNWGSDLWFWMWFANQNNQQTYRSTTIYSPAPATTKPSPVVKDEEEDEQATPAEEDEEQNAAPAEEDEPTVNEPEEEPTFTEEEEPEENFTMGGEDE